MALNIVAILLIIGGKIAARVGNAAFQVGMGQLDTTVDHPDQNTLSRLNTLVLHGRPGLVHIHIGIGKTLHRLRITVGGAVGHRLSRVFMGPLTGIIGIVAVKDGMIEIDDIGLRPLHCPQVAVKPGGPQAVHFAGGQQPRIGGDLAHLLHPVVTVNTVDLGAGGTGIKTYDKAFRDRKTHIAPLKNRHNLPDTGQGAQGSQYRFQIGPAVQPPYI